MVEVGIDSKMLVARQSTNYPGVNSGSDIKFRIANRLDRQLWRLQRSPHVGWRSPARFSSTSADFINRSRADVVNLHWVTAGFLSVEEIGRIDKPIIWTMHDMWPFTGTEHYVPESGEARWRDGYFKTNRPTGERGIDIDRLTWERKCRSWVNPINLVPVSSWLAQLASEGILTKSWPIKVIPNIMDTTQFSPVCKSDARQLLGIPADQPIICFISSAGLGDVRKGWELLESAMQEVRKRFPTAAVVVVGPHSSADETHRSFPIFWQGVVSDNKVLSQIIGASDVVAVPSKADNLPLTALEAHSCGRPVVAFRVGGLPDIVTHQQTGYLAAPFDTSDLANGIIEALNDSLSSATWGHNARVKAEHTWSSDAIVPQYLEIYQQACN